MNQLYNSCKILLAGFGLFFFTASALAQSSQCGSCVPDVNCTITPAFPALCPENLPEDTVGNPYDEVIQFYMPHNFDDPGSGFNVDLLEVEILDIVGMPLGMFWTNDIFPNMTYYPVSNPPDSEHGCVRICGTPILPFNDSIKVFVRVLADAGIATQEQVQSFKVGLTIHPSSGGNNSFTVSNPIDCAPVTTEFNTNFPSNGNPGYSYSWDFGNGFSSNAEDPPAITYQDSGEYVVTCHTEIDTLPYFLNSVTVDVASCNDNPWSAPDFYMILMQGTDTVFNTLEDFGSIADTDPPVDITFSQTTLDDLPYTIEIWDEDGGLLGGDDLCGTFNFNGHTAGTYTLNDGSTVIDYTVTHDVIAFTDTDTVTVLPLPIVPIISVSPNDSVCEGDSILLTASSNAAEYQWHRDTITLVNENDATYLTGDSGYHWVEAFSEFGCRSVSEEFHIAIIENPPTPTTWITGNTINTNLEGYDLQWFMNGDTLHGVTGLTYTITASGTYRIVATNFFGCTSISQPVTMDYNPPDTSGTGLADNEFLQEVQLFPNPNRGQFNLNFELKQDIDLNITIRDLLGKVVYEEQLNGQAGTYTKVFDLSRHGKGVYVVNLQGEGVLLNRKVVVD